jgi:hypothetical protein
MEIFVGFAWEDPDASADSPSCPGPRPGTTTTVTVVTGPLGQVTTVIGRVTTTITNGQASFRIVIDIIKVTQVGETRLVDMVRDFTNGGPTQESEHILETTKSGFPLGSGWI